jgi:hypothetical protein
MEKHIMDIKRRWDKARDIIWAIRNLQGDEQQELWSWILARVQYISTPPVSGTADEIIARIAGLAEGEQGKFWDWMEQVRPVFSTFSWPGGVDEMEMVRDSYLRFVHNGSRDPDRDAEIIRLNEEEDLTAAKILPIIKNRWPLMEDRKGKRTPLTVKGIRAVLTRHRNKQRRAISTNHVRNVTSTKPVRE